MTVQRVDTIIFLIGKETYQQIADKDEIKPQSNLDDILMSKFRPAIRPISSRKLKEFVSSQCSTERAKWKHMSGILNRRGKQLLK